MSTGNPSVQLGVTLQGVWGVAPSLPRMTGSLGARRFVCRTRACGPLSGSTDISTCVMNSPGLKSYKLSTAVSTPRTGAVVLPYVTCRACRTVGVTGAGVQ